MTGPVSGERPSPAVRLRVPPWMAIAAATYALLFWAAMLTYSNRIGILNAPPEAGDGPSYDAIAYNVAQGVGFGQDLGNVEWRRPYEAANATGEYDAMLALQTPYLPTFYRAPLFPVILAAIYRVCGRDFRIWRAVSLLLLSAGVVISALIAFMLGGLLPAVAVLVLPLFDSICQSYCAGYLAESLCLLGVSILMFLLLRLPESRRQCAGAVLAGFIAGLLVLARSVFIFWLPFMAYLVYKQAAPRSARRASLAFIVAALGAISPWCVRNVVFFSPEFPLGSQSAMTLSYAYSDGAIDSRGVFPHTRGGGQKNSPFGFSSDHTELMEAVESRRILAEWLASNWSRVPKLIAMRIVSLVWRDALPMQRAMLLGIIPGLFAVRRAAGLRVLLMPLLATLISTALTWNVVAGRFLIPIHPVLWIMAALALVWIPQGGKAVSGETVRSRGCR